MNAYVVLPFLNYAGINKIHAAFLSHEDTDHYNAIANVAAKRKIEHLYAAEKFTQNKDLLKTTKTLIDFLNTEDTHIELTPKTLSFGKTKITKLWPLNHPNPNISDNDNAEVMLIEYAQNKILLCSDIQKYAQQKLIQLYPTLDIDILIVPHHGSENNVMANFNTFFKPEKIIASCAQYQYKRIHSNPKNLYTCKDGKITINLNK